MTSEPLSTQAEFSAALWSVLTPTITWLEEHTAPFEPEVILLMGSAAYGEANGVRLPGGEGARFLPLSDLDIGIFVRRMGSPAERERFGRRLREALEPHAMRAGLTECPVDAGFISLPALARMPATLELCEVARRPYVLSGRPEILGDWIPADAAPFEAVRLLINRVCELLSGSLRPGPPRPTSGTEGWDGGRAGGWAEGWAGGRAGGWAGGRAGGRVEGWVSAPGPLDWKQAHRTSKLVLDFGKAFMALHGVLEPSVQRRLPLIEQALGDPSIPEAAELAVMMRWWSEWRREPTWPPPQASGRPLARLAERGLRDGAQACGVRAFSLEDEASWRAVLGCEGGPWRERTRRWWRMVARRPSQCPLGEALRFAHSWGASCWPATLGALLLCLHWTGTYLGADSAPAHPAGLWSAILEQDASDSLGGTGHGSVRAPKGSPASRSRSAVAGKIECLLPACNPDPREDREQQGQPGEQGRQGCPGQQRGILPPILGRLMDLIDWIERAGA